MSKPPDKRKRRDLDLFVLALVDSGVSTPYELQQAAGLSPGATVPALRRMAERGSVLAGKAGPRDRMAHRLTTAGRQLLKNGWKELLSGRPSCDLDADLRVALLALFIGGNRRLAVDFLRRSATLKLESLGKIQERDGQEPLSALAHHYKILRASSAKALIKAEAASAAAMARSLPIASGAKQRTQTKPKR